MTRPLIDKLVQWRLSLFLLVCIALGGTSQDLVYFKLFIYVLSLSLIAFSFYSRFYSDTPKLFRAPELLVLILIAAFFIYLIPLSPSLWTELAGRDIVLAGFESINMPPPWLPLSLTPETTFFSLFDFLPIIALSLLFRLNCSVDEKRIAANSILFIGIITSFLGVLQIIGGNGFYLYDVTNQGYAVGVFSNANHQACFLAACLPFTAIRLLQKTSRREFDAFSIHRIDFLAVFTFISLSVGIVLTGSLTGYIFLVVTFSLSSLIMIRETKFVKISILIALILFSIFIVDFIFLGNFLDELKDKLVTLDPGSRRAIYSNVMEARDTFGLFGTGPGSFLEVYKIQESRDSLTTTFIPNAHNDYLQTVLELGVLGIFWMLTCFILGVNYIRKLLKLTGDNKRIALLLCLTLLLPLSHSIIDYPLRTISIAVLFYYALISLDELVTQPLKGADA